MKRQTKTLVSCLLALAMLIGMTANCLAANSFTITKIEIIDSLGKVTDVTTEAAINVQQNAHVMRVTGILKDSTEAAVSGGSATYLAYDAAVDEGSKTLGNETIEYIDQMTTGADGTVSFMYRNRSTIPSGTAITAKAGGTDVSVVDDFSYNIVEDKGIMTITTNAAAITEGTATDVVFAITSTILPVASVTGVMLNAASVGAGNYTYEDGTLTILGSYVAELAVGSYTLTVTADGQETATYQNAIVINSAIVDIPEDKIEEIEGALENTVPVVSEDGKSASIPAPEGAVNGLAIEVQGTAANNVTVENGVVALKADVPFAKVDIKVSVIGSDISEQKTVYLVPDDAEVAFGNIGLHTVDGEDAFAYDPEKDEDTNDDNFEAMLADYGEANVMADISVARSIAISGDTDKYSHFGRALDFDHDGAYKLPEYRIFKLMMTKGAGHGFTAVNNARPAAPAQ